VEELVVVLPVGVPRDVEVLEDPGPLIFSRVSTMYRWPKFMGFGMTFAEKRILSPFSILYGVSSRAIRVRMDLSHFTGNMALSAPGNLSAMRS
jgi:hypothetical protein